MLCTTHPQKFRKEAATTTVCAQSRNRHGALRSPAHCTRWPAQQSFKEKHLTPKAAQRTLTTKRFISDSGAVGSVNNTALSSAQPGPTPLTTGVSFPTDLCDGDSLQSNKQPAEREKPGRRKEHRKRPQKVFNPWTVRIPSSLLRRYCA